MNERAMSGTAWQVNKRLLSAPVCLIVFQFNLKGNTKIDRENLLEYFLKLLSINSRKIKMHQNQMKENKNDIPSKYAHF